MWMAWKTKAEHYATIWTYNLEWEHKPWTRDSISQIWEITKQSLDIPGSQLSNPEWTGKEDGLTCHNSQSSCQPQMQQKPCIPPEQRMFLNPSEKSQTNISLGGSPLDLQTPMNQTPQSLKNTKGTAKYSVKLSPRDCPSRLYGIMQSNYYWSTGHPSRKTTPTHPGRKSGNAQICTRTPQKRDNLCIQITLCSQFLLCEEEGWKTMTSTRLQTYQ